MRENEQEAAEILGLRALGWLAGKDDQLSIFLESSGAALDDLRTRANDPAFLIAVLDFIMSEDQWLMEFCDATGLPYDAPDRARQMLPGGARVHWT